MPLLRGHEKGGGQEHQILHFLSVGNADGQGEADPRDGDLRAPCNEAHRIPFEPQVRGTSFTARSMGIDEAGDHAPAFKKKGGGAMEHALRRAWISFRDPRAGRQERGADPTGDDPFESSTR